MHSVFLWAGAFFLGLPVGSFLLPPPATLAPNATQIEGVVIEAPDRGLIADGLLVDVDSPARARVLLRMPHGNRGRHPEPCGAPGDRIRATVQLAPRRASLVPAFRSRRLAVRRGVQLYGEATECSVIAAGIDESFLARAVGTAIRSTEIAHAGILGALATGDRSGAF